MALMLRRLILLLVCTLLLAACEFGGTAAQDATATAGATKAGDTQVAAYPAPGSPTAIIAQPAPATTVAAPAPVAAPGAQAAALVGAEWTILASGDLNADKAADIVGIKLAQGVAPDVSFRAPAFTAYKGPATEVVIVQAGADGRPQVQAILTGGGLSAGGATVATFAGAAGYMVSVTPGSRPLISIQAMNQAGTPVGLPVGLEWTGSGYALFGRGK